MMRTLIVEDDFTSRMLLGELLSPYGKVHSATDGRAAVDAFKACYGQPDRYDLICLDIMMPEMDGFHVLREIRRIEEASDVCSTQGVKVIMTTALDRVRDVSQAYYNLCDAYLVKPIDKGRLLQQLREFGFLSEAGR